MILLLLAILLSCLFPPVWGISVQKVPGTGFQSPHFLTESNGYVFFQAYGTTSREVEVWASNGKSIYPITYGIKTKCKSADRMPCFTTFLGWTYFVGSDGKLYRSNGTANYYEQLFGHTGYAKVGMSVYHDYLIVSADNYLWKYDGSLGPPQKASTNKYYLSRPLLKTFNDELYFIAGNNVYAMNDTNIRGVAHFYRVSPYALAVTTDKLFFFAKTTHGYFDHRPYWTSDGETVYKVPEGGRISFSQGMASSGAFVYYYKMISNVPRLQVTNGDMYGPVNNSFRSAYRLTDLNGWLHFLADGGLWRTNGTALDFIVDLGGGDGSIFSNRLAATDDKLFLSADGPAGVNDNEIWVLEGNTGMVTRVPAGPIYPTEIAAVGDTVFLNSRSLSTGLWKVVFNEPPIAICQNVTMNANDIDKCTAEPREFDGGSNDPEDGPLTFAVNQAGTDYDLGVTPIELTVMDNQSASASCTAEMHCNDPPVAMCRNISRAVNTDNCTFESTGEDMKDAIDNESYDKDGSIVGRSMDPEGPVYALGDTFAKLTVTDNDGASSSCNATIIVNDPEDFSRSADCLYCGGDGIVDACMFPATLSPSYTKRNGCGTVIEVISHRCCTKKAKNCNALTSVDKEQLTLVKVGDDQFMEMNMTVCNDLPHPSHCSNLTCAFCVQELSHHCKDIVAEDATYTEQAHYPDYRGLRHGHRSLRHRCPDTWDPTVNDFVCT